MEGKQAVRQAAAEWGTDILRRRAVKGGEQVIELFVKAVHGGKAVRRPGGVLLRAVGAELPHAVDVKFQVSKRVTDRVLRHGARLVEETAQLGAAQFAAVARLGAVEQVVRLVKEEDIACVGRARLKIAAKIRCLVNQIVAVADDDVARLREVERQLVGADAVAVCRGGYCVGIVDAPLTDEVGKRIRHAPEMPLGARADGGRTLHRVAQLDRADALLCRDVHRADAGRRRHFPRRVQRGERGGVL